MANAIRRKERGCQKAGINGGPNGAGKLKGKPGTPATDVYAAKRLEVRRANWDKVKPHQVVNPKAPGSMKREGR